MPPIPVIVIADDALARAGLAAILNEQDAVQVVAQIAADDDLNAQLELYAPDVVVWDWDDDALERTNEFTETRHVLALVRDDADALHALAANARGILRREASAAQIVAAIQAIAAGLTVIEPDFLAQAAPARALDENTSIEELTPRENEVLRLLARGLANKTIAGELGISEHTVKFHVNAILGKLGAQSRTDAVVRATRRGLITL